VIQKIIAQADQFSATDVMQDEYDRAEMTRHIQQILANFDALMANSAYDLYHLKLKPIQF
jgi:allophanate hydrolase